MFENAVVFQFLFVEKLGVAKYTGELLLLSTFNPLMPPQVASHCVSAIAFVTYVRVKRAPYNKINVSCNNGNPAIQKKGSILLFISPEKEKF